MAKTFLLAALASGVNAFGSFGHSDVLCSASDVFTDDLDLDCHAWDSCIQGFWEHDDLEAATTFMHEGTAIKKVSFTEAPCLLVESCAPLPHAHALTLRSSTQLASDPETMCVVNVLYWSGQWEEFGTMWEGAWPAVVCPYPSNPGCKPFAPPCALAPSSHG